MATLDAILQVIKSSKDETAVIKAANTHLSYCKALGIISTPIASRAPTAKETELGKKAASEIAAQTAGENTEWGDVLRH